MAQIPATRGNAKASEIAVQTALATVGSQTREDLQATLGFVDSELNKLFGDRNAMLADGGIITLSAGNVMTFSQNLSLALNSNALNPGNANNPPVVISLGSSNRTFSGNGDMWYAVVDRTVGTATSAIVSASTGLPTVKAANNEIFLLAKRSDSADGTVVVYLRNGEAIPFGLNTRLGATGTAYASEFAVSDKTDPTKKIAFQASGNSSGASTTITSSASVNRVIALPDASTTIVGTDVPQTLSDKTFSNPITLNQVTTPSIPPAGADKLYFKSNNQLYSLNPSGVESQVSGALISPMTTKGDIIVRDASSPVRLGVGSNLQVLTADNTAATGMKWANGPVPLLQNVTVSANYTAATLDDTILLNASGGGFIVSLPTATGIAGKAYRFKKLDSSFNAITIQTTGGQGIDGDGSTTTLNTQWESLIISTDGFNWQIQSRTYPNTWKSHSFGNWGGITGVGSVEGFYRRVGDSLECRVVFNAIGAGASPGGILVPTGLTIDSTKLSSTKTVCGYYNISSGSAYYYNINAVQYSGLIAFNASSPTQVYLSDRANASSNISTSENINSMVGSGALLSANFTVPISGWK